jgi:hypothetical protein
VTPGRLRADTDSKTGDAWELLLHRAVASSFAVPRRRSEHVLKEHAYVLKEHVYVLSPSVASSFAVPRRRSEHVLKEHAYVLKEHVYVLSPSVASSFAVPRCRHVVGYAILGGLH